MPVRQGTILSVQVARQGGTLVEAAQAGATLLRLDNVTAFVASGGSGMMRQETAVSDIIETIRYGGVDASESVVQLTVPLSNAYDAGADVFTDGETTWASVDLDDGFEPILAEVSHALKISSSLSEGIRDRDDAERVLIDEIAGRWMLVEVIGRANKIDGSTIDPETTVTPGALTDGFAPPYSPTPEAFGAMGVVLLRWNAVPNPDSVTYEVHISALPNFTEPTPATLLDEVKGTQASVKALPTNAPLEYDTSYQVILVAKDADGAAEPGTPVTVSMDRVRNADLWADAIDGMTITGALFRTASGGERIEISTANGLVGYAPDGFTPKTIIEASSGKLFAVDVTLDGVITARGGSITGVLDVTGALNLQSGSNITVNGSGHVINWGPASYSKMSDGEVTVGAIVDGNLVHPIASLRPNLLILQRTGGLYGSIAIDGQANMTMSSSGDVLSRGDRHAEVTALGGSATVYGGVNVSLSAADELRFYTLGTTEFAQRIMQTGAVYFPRIDFGSTSVANARLDSSGQLRITSSVRANKLAIESLTLERLRPLLDVEPKTWFDRSDSEALAAALETPVPYSPEFDLLERVRRIPGVIAEDVLEAGLPEFVETAADGSLRGVGYERIGSMWMPFVKDLVERVGMLEAERSASA
jgi:hypothetical protein